MIVTYEHDAHACDAPPVHTAVASQWDWLVCRAEDQAFTAIQTDRELPGTVAFEWVWIPSDQFADMAGCLQVG